MTRALNYYSLAFQIGLRSAAEWTLTHQLLFAYFTSIGLAEVVTAAINPAWGLGLHAAILASLLWNGARTHDESERRLLFCLTLAPMTRICSLSLPLADFPREYWLLIATAPVALGAVVAARTFGYSRRDLGLALRWQALGPELLVLIPLGLLLGVGQYYIFQPQPLATSFSLKAIWLPVVVLFLSSGLAEEAIYRGLLLHAARKSLGRNAAVVCISLLYASLNFGYLSLPDAIFVFCVGLLLASMVVRSGTISGAVIVHSALNLSLFILMPLWVAPALT